MLGNALTHGRRWRRAGLALHVADGALFGLAFHEAWARLTVPPRRLALGMALAEHVRSTRSPSSSTATTPGPHEARVPPPLTTSRTFAQATWQHTLFGVVLGRLA